MIRIIERTDLYEQGKIRLLIEVPSFIDEQFVKNALEKKFRETTNSKVKLDIADTINEVKRKFGLNHRKFIYSDNAILARQIAVYICRENKHTYIEIQRYMTKFGVNDLGHFYSALKRKLLSNSTTIEPYRKFIKTYT